MFRFIPAAAMLAALTACAPNTYEMTNNFDPAEAAFATKPGRATVTGQAFLRQRGGGVVTCAGSEVALMPSVKYTNEFITKSFGSTEGGVAGPFAPAPSSDKIDPRLASMTKKAQCDAGGNFTFSNVPPGAYWALTRVTWSVGNNVMSEGGWITRRVIVPASGSIQAILTQ